MKNLYKLEFNEEQQQFHNNYGQFEENTNGFFTVIDSCSDLKFHVFESYIKRNRQEKLTKEYLLKSAVELQTFLNNLTEKQIDINFKF